MNQTDFFKCLSDPTRLEILKLILLKKNICVCEFAEYLQLSQPKISRHLALLRNNSILFGQRQGQWVYYSLSPDLPVWAIDVLNTIAAHSDIQNISSSASVPCESFKE